MALTVELPAGGWVVFWSLLVLRLLFGMFQAGGFLAWARVIADWMPVPERGLAQGVVWTFSRMGGAVSPFFTSLWRCPRICRSSVSTRAEHPAALARPIRRSMNSRSRIT